MYLLRSETIFCRRNLRHKEKSQDRKGRKDTLEGSCTILTIVEVKSAFPCRYLSDAVVSVSTKTYKFNLLKLKSC
jgi:hypothetical protein